jgi:hypothetical protein
MELTSNRRHWSPFEIRLLALVNPVCMSALGHKRTFAVHQAMSALPLRADIAIVPWLSPMSGQTYDLGRSNDGGT